MTDTPETRKAQMASQFSSLATEYDAAGCFRYFGMRLVDAAGLPPSRLEEHIDTDREYWPYRL